MIWFEVFIAETVIKPFFYLNKREKLKNQNNHKNNYIKK